MKTVSVGDREAYDRELAELLANLLVAAVRRVEALNTAPAVNTVGMAPGGPVNMEPADTVYTAPVSPVGMAPVSPVNMADPAKHYTPEDALARANQPEPGPVAGIDRRDAPLGLVPDARARRTSNRRQCGG